MWNRTGANRISDALRPWTVPVFTWALAVLMTHVFWSLAVHGAPFLVYLSNWLYTFNMVYYAIIVIGGTVTAVRRVALLAAPPILAMDVMWAVYTVGLAVYGASCFANTQSSRLFYYIFSTAQGYGHFSPLLFLAFYGVAEGTAIVHTWADVLQRWFPRNGLARAAALFPATLAWLTVPALPCFVYSYATDAVVVYGLSVTLTQISLILVYAVAAEAIVALLPWIAITWLAFGGRTKSGKAE